MKILSLLALLTIFLTPTYSIAEGVDHVFKGSHPRSFGQTVRNLFNLSSYNKSYAVVVGISNYTGGFSSISSAHNDAKRMKDFLVNEAGFDYVHVLTEEKVTHNRLYEIMTELSRKIGKQDRFTFYWSGHGKSYQINGKNIGFLPFTNSSTSDLSDMLMMSTIKQWDTLIQANQVLYIVDACFSGLANANETKSTRYDLMISQLAQPSRQILTAGQSDETTISSEHYHGSLFTTAVIEALNGKSEMASKYHSDGVISATELMLAVRERINHEVETNDSLRKFKLTPTLKEIKYSSGDFFFLSRTKKTRNTLKTFPNLKNNKIEVKKHTNRKNIIPFNEHSHDANQYTRSTVHTHPNGSKVHSHNYAGEKLKNRLNQPSIVKTKKKLRAHPQKITNSQSTKKDLDLPKTTSLLDLAKSLRNQENQTLSTIKNDLKTLFSLSDFTISSPDLIIENEKESTVVFNIDYRSNQKKITSIFSKYGFIINEKLWIEDYEDSTVITIPLKKDEPSQKNREFLSKILNKLTYNDFFIEFTTNTNKKKYLRLTYRHQFDYSGIYYIFTIGNKKLKFKNIKNEELNSFRITNYKVIYIDPGDIGY